jgi:hypothetical protein
MDDFMFMVHSREVTTLPRRVEALLHRLGPQRNPKKVMLEPTQVGDPLGYTIDLQKGEFRDSCDKLMTVNPCTHGMA